MPYQPAFNTEVTVFVRVAFIVCDRIYCARQPYYAGRLAFDIPDCLTVPYRLCRTGPPIRPQCAVPDHPCLTRPPHCTGPPDCAGPPVLYRDALLSCFVQSTVKSRLIMQSFVLEA